MTQRCAYLNGEWVPESEAKVSVLDRGFTLGDGIYEALRTFQHRPFKVREHAARMFASLKIARIDPGFGQAELERILVEVAERNSPCFDPDDDFTIYPTITRGVGGHPLKCRKPTVVVTARPISWMEYSGFYGTGVHLVTPSTRRQPPQCWDAKIKTTSRFHHTIADIEVGLVDPDAWCLMLDLDGNVSEHRSSNVALVKDGRIETPDSRNALRGTSLGTSVALAQELGIVVVERPLQLYDFLTADEVFLTSTSFCVLPAAKINGVPVGQGVPGPVTRKLLHAFSELVGMNIVEQAIRRSAQVTHP